MSAMLRIKILLSITVKNGCFELTGSVSTPVIRPGQVTLIDCWASWCAPCRAAIPAVKALYDRYNRDRFDVISISLDSKKEDWQKALREEKMPWPQFIAGNKGYEQLTLRYNISSIPNLILIDGEGRVVYNTFSPEEIKIELEQMLK